MGVGSATPEETGPVAERLRQAIGGRPVVIDAENREPSARGLGVASPQARFGQAAPTSEAPLTRVGITMSVGVAMGPSGQLDSRRPDPPRRRCPRRGQARRARRGLGLSARRGLTAGPP